MSNFGQAALSIAGFAVGSFFGYPQLGFVLGSLAGQAVFPTQLPGISGPKLTDTKTTVSQVGAPVMEAFGTDAVPGVIIYAGPIIETSTTEDVGGKGGPEQEVTTYTYTQTIAIGLCRAGRHRSVSRIWENGKLVYDVRGESLQARIDAADAMTDTDQADQALELLSDTINGYRNSFVFYDGNSEQLPDPTIEAERAEAGDEAPAYRGIVSIVFPNRQLQQEQGLRHPNFKFELSEHDENSFFFDAEDQNLVMTIRQDPTPAEYYGYVGVSGLGVGPMGQMLGNHFLLGAGNIRLKIAWLYWDATILTAANPGRLYLGLQNFDDSTPASPAAFTSLSYVGGVSTYTFARGSATGSGGAAGALVGGAREWSWQMPMSGGSPDAAAQLSLGQKHITFLPTLQVTREFSIASPDTRVALDDVVQSICLRAGYTADELDVSDLAGRYIYGYTVSRVMTGLDALEPLRKVGYFDIVESGQTIRFVVRGHGHVRVLSADDIGAHDGAQDNPPVALTTRMMQDVELPRQLRLHYRNVARDYEDDEQLSPSRLSTGAINDVDIELPVAIDGEMAAQIAEVLWAEQWAGRFLHDTTVDGTHLDLEPSDVLMVPVDGRQERVRILTIDDAVVSLRKLELVRDDDGSYVSTAVAEDPLTTPASLEVISGTELLFLELPPLRTQDTDAGFYMAVWNNGLGTRWRGVTIYRSTDGGSTFELLTSASTSAAVGTISGALPVGDLPTGSPLSWDEDSTLTVVLESGTLESRSENDVLAGANAAAVGIDGRWEIVQFANAVQVDTGVWQLSRFLRGRRGTESFIGYSQAGDRFVLLDGVIHVPLTTAQLGQTYTYKLVSNGAALADGTIDTHAGQGRILVPFAPNNISGALEGDGDAVITWSRRDRLGQELTYYVDPISDAPLSFEVDILQSGSPTSVLRTLTSSTEQVTYTLAQQTTDFGTPPVTLSVNIYQVSATVGRGFVGQATLALSLAGSIGLSFATSAQLSARGNMSGSSSITFGGSANIGSAGGEVVMLTAGAGFGFNGYEEFGAGFVTPSTITLNSGSVSLQMIGSGTSTPWTFTVRMTQPASSQSEFSSVSFVDNTSTPRTFTSASASYSYSGGAGTWTWNGPASATLFDSGSDYEVTFSL